MAKTNITQYSSTPSSNTDINNINIDENCPASGLNNAIRELMAHLKNVDTGSQALTSPSFTAMSTDTISEKTSANGVAIDGVTLKDGGVGTASSPVALYATSLNGGQFGGRRNLIINGAMQVAQRGTSHTPTTSEVYTLDRFKIFPQGSTAGRATITQDSSAPNGFANSLKIDVTTADTSIAASEAYILGYQAEGQDVQMFKKGTSEAEQYTVSFYVKGNASATYVLELFDVDNSRQISKTFNVTTDWARVIMTFPSDTTGSFDNDNASSLALFFHLHAGSTYTSGTINSSAWAANTNANRVGSGTTSIFDSTDRTFFITGIQLEVGSVATPFEHRSYGEEIALCRRYCTALMDYGAGDVTGNGLYNADYNGNTNMSFIRMGYTQMREKPNITYGSNATVQTDYSSNGLIQFFLGSSVNWRIYDVLLESEL